MSFALIVIGIAAIMTAINNTWKTGPNGQGNGLFPQLAQDFFTEGYLYWLSALIIVGFVGYIPGLRKPADAFMVLILVAMLLKNNNVFSEFSTDIQNISGDSGSGAVATALSQGQSAQIPGLNATVYPGGVTVPNSTNTGGFSPSNLSGLNLGMQLLGNSGVGTIASNTSSANLGGFSPSF